MNPNFSIERLYFPEGEGIGTIDPGTYFISMADTGGTFIEWTMGGKRERKRRPVVSGDIWVLPPGHSWWTRREAGKTCIQLSLSAQWLAQITQAPFDIPLQVCLRDTLLAQMLRTLAQTSAQPQTPTGSLYQESLASTLVLHLLNHHGRNRANQSTAAPLSSTRLSAISHYIDERLSEKITLADLADLAGLSISQFSLRFRETTGQTPHQFVTTQRIERARQMLLSGKHTPAQIAALTGFADQSHLTRHMRRLLGTTPGILQKQ